MESVCSGIPWHSCVFLIDAIVMSQSQRGRDGNSNLIKAILLAICSFSLSFSHVFCIWWAPNPISSFTAGLIGLISLSRAFIYIMAQCLGAILGAFALKFSSSEFITHTLSQGGCTLLAITSISNGTITTRIETPQALCLEIVCPFVFPFASRWVSFDPKQLAILGRLMVCVSVGLGVGLNVLVSETVRAGINPARCLGPAVVRGGYLWNGHWIFWIGPSISCIVFYLYTRIIPDDNLQPEKRKHDFLNILKAIVASDEDEKGQ